MKNIKLIIGALVLFVALIVNVTIEPGRNKTVSNSSIVSLSKIAMADIETGGDMTTEYDFVYNGNCYICYPYQDVCYISLQCCLLEPPYC